MNREHIPAPADAVCPNCRTPLGEPLAEIGVVNTPFIGQAGYSNNPLWTPQTHACVACVHLPGDRPERVKPFCTGGEVWSLYTPGPRHWLVEGQPDRGRYRVFTVGHGE